MKTVRLGNTQIEVPAIALGCMRIQSLDEKALDALLCTALENGIDFFDHADIYGRGECERLFGAACRRLKLKRDDMYIQSKCGIVPGVMYDLSYQHIVKSAENILSRLGVDYLDCLLLHRPDALMQPEEIAQAFTYLHESGKVKNFGVSNFRPGQIELLRQQVTLPIVCNQIQFSVAFAGIVSSGMEANMETSGAIERDGAMLEYCRKTGITMQAWSPFQYGYFEGTYLGSDKYPQLNAVLQQLAEKYSVTPAAIAAAWILRHPANMQVIVGTTNSQRLSNIARASEIDLMRDEWYKLYVSAGHLLP